MKDIDVAQFEIQKHIVIDDQNISPILSEY